MLGRLEFVRGGRGKGARGELYGLPVLRVQTDPEYGFGAWRLNRAGAYLRRAGTTRVLLPRTFDRWEMLTRYGLRRVEPDPFLRFCAPQLTLRGLLRQDVDPARATVALSGRWADGAMARTAARLCPHVRRLVVDVPGGEELALWLREEFGVPVLPREEPAQLALCFQPDGSARRQTRLELYGCRPELAGVEVCAPGLGAEERDDLSLLCALWEGGKLDVEGLKFI